MVRGRDKMQMTTVGRFSHVVFVDDRRQSRRVVDFSTRPDPVDDAPLSDEESRLVNELFHHAGLDRGDYRSETLRRRVAACLRALGCTTPAKALQQIRRDRRAVERCLSTMVIGVTRFFRDSAVYDYIEGKIIPSWIRTHTAPRVWSAGCSDGSELYSVLLQLAEADLLGRSDLLGSDCRATAITSARIAQYSAESLAEVPQRYHHLFNPRTRAEFFPSAPRRGGPLATEAASLRPISIYWEIEPRLRVNTRFRQESVLSPADEPPFDLVMCRNLAIYLEPSAAARLWRLMESRIKPGGYLITGKAERIDCVEKLVRLAPCIYRMPP